MISTYKEKAPEYIGINSYKRNNISETHKYFYKHVSPSMTTATQSLGKTRCFCLLPSAHQRVTGRRKWGRMWYVWRNKCVLLISYLSSKLVTSLYLGDLSLEVELIYFSIDSIIIAHNIICEKWSKRFGTITSLIFVINMLYGVLKKNYLSFIITGASNGVKQNGLSCIRQTRHSWWFSL